jgi:hypothetical protein
MFDWIFDFLLALKIDNINKWWPQKNITHLMKRNMKEFGKKNPNAKKSYKFQYFK